jgi:hypothetical protein
MEKYKKELGETRGENARYWKSTMKKRITSTDMRDKWKT